MVAGCGIENVHLTGEVGRVGFGRLEGTCENGGQA